MPNEIEISDSADDAEYFVGARLTDPMHFPDNLVSQCTRCFHMIQHRPDVPKHLRMICLVCAMPDMQTAADVGDLRIRTSSRHRDEFLDWLKKKQN